MVLKISDLAPAERVGAAYEARLLRWLRRQVNTDLRWWRYDCPPGVPHSRRVDGVADCKAKLDLITWADGWHATVRQPPGDMPPATYRVMHDHLAVAMEAVRLLTQAYQDRPGWRAEWDQPPPEPPGLQRLNALAVQEIAGRSDLPAILQKITKRARQADPGNEQEKEAEGWTFPSSK